MKRNIQWIFLLIVPLLFVFSFPAAAQSGTDADITATATSATGSSDSAVPNNAAAPAAAAADAASTTATDPSADLYQQQLDASGANDVYDNLPDDTKQLLASLGITSLDINGGLTALSPQTLLQKLLDMLVSGSGGVLAGFGVLLGIIVLCALADGMRHAAEGPSEVQEIFTVIGALAACAAVLVPVSKCVLNVGQAAQSVSVFMTSFTPAYVAVLVAGGQPVSAAAFNSIVLFVAQLLTLFATGVLVPMMSISLALGVTGAVNPGLRTDAVGGMLNKSVGWVVGIGTSLFVGLLTIQNVITSATDSLAGRALKLSLASMVPVVGSALGEAVNTVRGSVGLLKSTLGGFGIVATALIVLPPLITCALWSFSLSLSAAAAEMFGLTPVTTLIKAAHSVIKTLIAVLAACGLFMIIATIILTKTAAP